MCFFAKGSREVSGGWVEGTWGQDNFFYDGRNKNGNCLVMGMIQEGGNTVIGDGRETCLRDVCCP